MLAAAHAAGLAPTLARLPQALETQIGEGGAGLSVGERQRVQIARALAGRPRILVLDEATANLDYATEREIRTALLQPSDRPTTLVIAHRYSMIENADHVLVLEDGRVEESGTVAQLIARGGWFAAFAASARGATLETAADSEESNVESDASGEEPKMAAEDEEEEDAEDEEEEDAENDGDTESEADEEEDADGEAENEADVEDAEDEEEEAV